MTLQEIKNKIQGADPGEIVALAKEFKRTINKLSDEHQHFDDFNGEYYSDMVSLQFTRDPANGNKLERLVDIAIDLQNKSKF